MAQRSHFSNVAQDYFHEFRAHRVSAAGVPEMEHDLIRDGEKYALIAVQTRSSVDVHPTEMAPGFWVSSTPMISIDAHWKAWLCTIRVGRIHIRNLFLMVKAQAAP